MPAVAPNPVTGKTPPGGRYEAATVAHCESVLRGFYDFHLEAGTGPMVNPFPLARGRRAGRVRAHRSPMEPVAAERAGRYRPKVVARAPRSIPDARFNEVFAQLGSHRDRALVAFWVSTGARAAELLGATVGDVDPGQQLITVVRKGTRALQPLPASPDAFVWLRLYEAQLQGMVPAGRDQPLWWTLRRPWRALSYDAARLMFTRANAALGANLCMAFLHTHRAFSVTRSHPITERSIFRGGVWWIFGGAHDAAQTTTGCVVVVADTNPVWTPPSPCRAPSGSPWPSTKTHQTPSSERCPGTLHADPASAHAADQRGPQVSGGLVAVPGVFRQRGQHDAVEFRRHGGADR